MLMIESIRVILPFTCKLISFNSSTRDGKLMLSHPAKKGRRTAIEKERTDSSGTAYVYYVVHILVLPRTIHPVRSSSTETRKAVLEGSNYTCPKSSSISPTVCVHASMLGTLAAAIPPVLSGREGGGRGGRGGG